MSLSVWRRIHRAASAAILLLLGLVCGTAAQGGAQREPEVHVYAAPKGTELKAYVFSPVETGGGRRSAIVLLHGGGWTTGEPEWAFARARHFADRGMVAIAAQYRLSDYKDITPIEAIEDVRSAFRWLRLRADTLRVDPRRVVAYGWSAGAHLAVFAAILDTAASRADVSGGPDALWPEPDPAVSADAMARADRFLGSLGFLK